MAHDPKFDEPERRSLGMPHVTQPPWGEYERPESFEQWYLWFMDQSVLAQKYLMGIYFPQIDRGSRCAIELHESRLADLNEGIHYAQLRVRRYRLAWYSARRRAQSYRSLVDWQNRDHDASPVPLLTLGQVKLIQSITSEQLRAVAPLRTFIETTAKMMRPMMDDYQLTFASAYWRRVENVWRERWGRDA